MNERFERILEKEDGCSSIAGRILGDLDVFKKDLTVYENDADSIIDYLCFVETVTKTPISINKDKCKISNVAKEVLNSIENGTYKLDKEGKEILTEYSNYILDELDCTFNAKVWNSFIEYFADIYLSQAKIKETIATRFYNLWSKEEDKHPSKAFTFTSVLYEFASKIIGTSKNVLEFGYDNEVVDISYLTSKKATSFTKLCSSKDSLIYNERIDYFFNKKRTNMISEIGTLHKSDDKEKYDFIFGKLPNSLGTLEFWNPDLLKYDKWNAHSIWEYMHSILSLLSSNGKAAIVFPTSALNNDKDAKLRKYYVDNGYIEAVISIKSEWESMFNGDKTMIIFSRNNKKLKYYTLEDNSWAGINLNHGSHYEKYLNEAQEADLVEIQSKKYKISFESLSVKKPVFKNSVTIKDIALDVFRGCQTLKDSNGENDKLKGPFEVVNTGYINENYYPRHDFDIDYDFKYIEAKKLNQFELKSGDVLITCKFSSFKVAVYNPLVIRERIPSGNLIVIRVNEEKMKPEYLAAYLNSKIGRSQIDLITTGESICSINKLALLELEIPKFDYEKEKEIANSYRDSIKSIEEKKWEILKEKQKMNELFK